MYKDYSMVCSQFDAIDKRKWFSTCQAVTIRVTQLPERLSESVGCLDSLSESGGYQWYVTILPQRFFGMWSHGWHGVWSKIQCYISCMLKQKLD